MNVIIEHYLVVASVLWLLLTGLWLLSLAVRDASIIDIFWGFGFVVANWTSLALIDDDVHARQWLIHAMVTIWGLRLTIHLFIRNVGEGEDARYQSFRRRGGPLWWLKSYPNVFLLQGLIMLVVASPVIVVNASEVQPPLGWVDVIGSALWCVGFAFEVIGDQQLIRFRRDPANAGAVMDKGLWRYTLHPNYFGDATQWWAMWLVAASAPLGIWTFVGPLAMTAVFLNLTSGILERSLSRRRPEYAAYVARTSRFFPMPPKSSGRAA
jgi:steroid 5-alpha reductase family enzyme